MGARARSLGFSLVELMVASAAGLIVALVVTGSVLSVGRQFSIVGSNVAAQSNAQVALSLIDASGRSAGSGFYSSGKLICPMWNAWNGSSLISDGQVFMPARIIDGGASTQSDVIVFTGGNSGAGALSALPVMTNTPSTADIKVSGGAQLRTDDVAVIGAPGSGQPCTLFQVTASRGGSHRSRPGDPNFGRRTGQRRRRLLCPGHQLRHCGHGRRRGEQGTVGIQAHQHGLFLRDFADRENLRWLESRGGVRLSQRQRRRWLGWRRSRPCVGAESKNRSRRERVHHARWLRKHIRFVGIGLSGQDGERRSGRPHSVRVWRRLTRQCVALRFERDQRHPPPVRVAAVAAPNGSAQPITAPPVIGPVSGSTSKFYIYFGTGQYFSTDDVPGTTAPDVFATQTESFYGIVDDTANSSPSLPNVRGSNGSSCPSGGGNGDLVCQLSVLSPTGNFTATFNAVNLSSKRGFYMDIPISNGRVNTQPALTSKGTLVFAVNQPSTTICNPGGSSYFFQLNAATGGAVPQTSNGQTYYDVGFRLADALSSRPVLVTTGTGVRAIFRLSDKTTQSRQVNETSTVAALFKRVYKRALN